MQYCTREHILDLLYEPFVNKAEELNPGLVERTIEAVSNEVADLLSYRYPQPWALIPELIRYITAVIAAYRIVEAITTLVDTESSSDNEWLPLQKQWEYCKELLDDLAKGKLKLSFGDEYADREEPSVAVISEGRTFDLRGF